MLKIIDTQKLQDLCAAAQASPRQRSNFNLHTELADPVQRFLNAIEPGSYIRPHRHTTPVDKWELFVILSGAAAVLTFDDEGRVAERLELEAGGSNIAAEIPAGAWHTLAILKPGTVLFEFKPGPYSPTSDKDFAAWAPSEGEPESAAMAIHFSKATVGDLLAGRK